jgi:hypothetical protein
MAHPPSNYNVSYFDPNGPDGKPESTGDGDGLWAASREDAFRQATEMVRRESKRVGVTLWGSVYDESSDQGDWIGDVKP